MRHVRSILYALVLAPAAWVLAGVGLTSDLTTRGRDDFAVESLVGLLMLVLAGAAYGILTFAPISPAGPTLAGVVFMAVTLWALNAPDSYANAWPGGVSKEGFDLSRPGYGVAALLAVPLLATALSVRRWQRFEPVVLPIIGQVGRARGSAPVAGTPIAVIETAALGTPMTDAEPTTVLRVGGTDSTTTVIAGASRDEGDHTTVLAQDDRTVAFPAGASLEPETDPVVAVHEPVTDSGTAKPLPAGEKTDAPTEKSETDLFEPTSEPETESRTPSEEPETESRAPGEEPETEPIEATEEPPTEPLDDTDEPATEPLDGTDEPATEPISGTDQSATEPVETTDEPTTEPLAATAQPETGPTDDEPATEPVDATAEPTTEPLTATEEPTTEPIDAGDEPATEPLDTAGQPATGPTDDEPATEPVEVAAEPTTEPIDTADEPATEPVGFAVPAVAEDADVTRPLSLPEDIEQTRNFALGDPDRTDAVPDHDEVTRSLLPEDIEQTRNFALGDPDRTDAVPDHEEVTRSLALSDPARAGSIPVPVDDGERTQVIPGWHATPRTPFDPERTMAISTARAEDDPDRTQYLAFVPPEPAPPVTLPGDDDEPTTVISGLGEGTRRIPHSTVEPPGERTQVFRAPSIAAAEAPDFAEDPTGRIVPAEAGERPTSTVADEERPGDETRTIPIQRRPAVED